MGTDEPNRGRALLEVEGLVLTRPGFSLRVDALRLGAGEALALLGPSGSGKSSLLAAIAGHLRPDDPLRIEGAIRIDGQPRPAAGPAARALRRGPLLFVPQDARAALDPLRPLAAQVAELAGAGADAVRGAFARLGLADLGARLPHQVSGGQARRALLAVALLREAGLCLLDEPSAGLDRPRITELGAALRILRQAGRGLLLATHDRALAADLGADLGARTLSIEAGRVVAGAAPPAPALPRAAPAEAGSGRLAACEGLGVRAGRSWLVRRVDLEIRRGENVALVGPSGAGKTTVGRALAGLCRPSSGRVVRPRRRRAVQMLFQDAGGSLTPHRRLGSLCAEAAAPGLDLGAEARALGLGAALLERRAAELSGGEQRRAALLRALCARPELLVLDEPTASLDPDRACQVVEALLAVRARTGLAMLWITHDDELAAAVAERVVRIEGGCT
jgi:peptide/nickel transport system ATP-binding protein